jgi:hypothetical protein
MGAMGSFLLLISSVRRGFLAFSLCWCKVRHLIRGLMLGLGSPASLEISKKSVVDYRLYKCCNALITPI